MKFRLWRSQTNVSKPPRSGLATWISVAAAAAISAPAIAQDAGAPAGGFGSSIAGQLLFFVPLILIFYFLLIRPQQQQRKKHQQMIDGLKRGDTVVTYGGLIAKVTKVNEDEITVELADGVRARMVRSMVADLRGKDTPAAAND
ncbi:MAG: preprotein translocase subunit YajC [Pseudomonadota bacterium]